MTKLVFRWLIRGARWLWHPAPWFFMTWLLIALLWRRMDYQEAHLKVTDLRIAGAADRLEVLDNAVRGARGLVFDSVGVARANRLPPWMIDARLAQTLGPEVPGDD